MKNNEKLKIIQKNILVLKRKNNETAINKNIFSEYISNNRKSKDKELKERSKINLTKNSKINIYKKTNKIFQNSTLKTNFKFNIFNSSNDSKGNINEKSLKSINTNSQNSNKNIIIKEKKRKKPSFNQTKSRNIKNIINGVNIILTTNNYTNYSKNEFSSNYYLTLNHKNCDSFNKNHTLNKSLKKKNNPSYESSTNRKHPSNKSSRNKLKEINNLSNTQNHNFWNRKVSFLCFANKNKKSESINYPNINTKSYSVRFGKAFQKK